MAHIWVHAWNPQCDGPRRLQMHECVQALTRETIFSSTAVNSRQSEVFIKVSSQDTIYLVPATISPLKV